MIGPKIECGLDLPDFEITNNTLKFTWTKRLHESNDNSQVSAPYLFAFKTGGRFFPVQDESIYVLKDISLLKRKNCVKPAQQF